MGTKNMKLLTMMVLSSLAIQTTNAQIMNGSARVRFSKDPANTSILHPIVVKITTAGQLRPKKLLVRGVGPTLWSYGVPDAAGVVYFYAGGKQYSGYDTYKGQNQLATLLGAFPLTGSSTNEVQAVFYAGVGEQAFNFYGGFWDHINEATILAEVWDADRSVAPFLNGRLASLSVQSFVGDRQQSILGFIVAAPVSVLIRGPAQSLRGIAPWVNTDKPLMQDPMLTLYRSGVQIAQNQGWWGYKAQVEKMTAKLRLTPLSSTFDPAMVLTLGSGNYTVVMQDQNGGPLNAGDCRLEIYDVTGM